MLTGDNELEQPQEPEDVKEDHDGQQVVLGVGHETGRAAHGRIPGRLDPE